MPATQTVSDEPIWNESTLREMVRDTRRSAQTRSWALETLERICGQQAVVSLAVDMLEDDEPHVAARALTLLEHSGDAECSEPVARFSKRDDVPQWSKLMATAILGCCGDKEAQRRAFATDKTHVYLSTWAERDPQGFAEAACEAWSDELATDATFLKAAGAAAVPRLARPLLDAIGGLHPDDDARLDLVMTCLARAGFGLPELGEDMPIVWHPREEATFDSRVDPDTLEARTDELAELVAHAGWTDVADHCLETIELVGQMGARDLDAPTLQWAFALSDTLSDEPELIAESYERARLCFALKEAVLLVFDIETTLERRGELEDVLALYEWSVGSQRDRLEELIEARWQATDAHQQAVTNWLDELDDEFEWFDALSVASGLDGYDILPCLIALVSEMEDDRAGYDIDWAADTLLDVLEQRPHAIAEQPQRLLLEDTVVSECTVQALGSQPYRWASELLLDHFDELSSTEENEILWESFAELSDPDSLDVLIERWEPGELRLAHAIGFVADVTGRLEELPEGIREDLDQLSRVEARYQKRMEAIIDGTSELEAALPDGDGLDLELVCSECDTRDTYHFDELYLDYERDIDLDEPFSVLLPDRVVECTNCHAKESLEAPERTDRSLAAMLTALIRADDWPEDAPVQVWHPEMWDGTTFSSPLEAINRLKAQAEAQPERAEPWRRLGHFCTRFHADDDAKSAYEHADTIDHKGVPDPKELRDLGIPTAPVGPEEADELLAKKRGQDERDEESTSKAKELREHPLHECLVSAHWRQVEGLCSVFVSRKVSDDRFVAAAFLVDLGCQGVKEVIFATSLGADRYADLKGRLESIHGALEDCTPELATRILETAVRFSLALGFFPPDDYFAAREMLAGYDPDATDEDVPTGEAGLPLYVGDPDAAEPAIERLYRRTGPDGFASL